MGCTSHNFGRKRMGDAPPMPPNMYDWEFDSAHNVKIKTKDSSTEDMSFCKRVDCDRILLDDNRFAHRFLVSGF